MDKDNIHLPQAADTYSLGSGLSIYTKSDIKNNIKITNNRAHYFANLAKKFRDEAKIHCDNAKHYAEENSNVTYDQLIDLRTVLETEIKKKEESGDYALKNELPVNVSELVNDSDYATKEEVNLVVNTVIPEKNNNSNKFLYTDGNTLSWKEVKNTQMFSIAKFDKILNFEESKGYALQGTYVYKESAPERYGYPNFYNKCLEEKTAGTETQTALGSSTITTYNNANGHIFYDIADKDIVDNYFASTGIAWLYGIDSENERIFLPRAEICNFAQGKYLTTIPAGGNGKSLGLTNGTQESHLYSHNVSGSYGLYAVTPATTNLPASNYGNRVYGDTGVTTNPNNSGVVAYTSGLAPRGATSYLYIVVGNTEQESAITDVTEITTSENDTIPLFTGMYFDFAPNNASWLKAGTQQNSGGIYTSCYNTLVNCLTEANNIYGLKVIETADMVAGVDYSEYWKVDQNEMYFIMPTKLSYGVYESTALVRGNGTTLGLYNGTSYVGLTGNDHNSNANLFNTPLYGKKIGTPETQTFITSAVSYGITPDSSKSGIVADLQVARAQLYFKVANAVQNLELLDAGTVLEALANKMDKQEYKNYITKTYQNGTSWYRIYSDGWCEQGGYVNQSANPVTVTFLKPFKNANYTMSFGMNRNGVNSAYATGYLQKKATSIQVTNYNNLSADWRACGYIN